MMMGTGRHCWSMSTQSFSLFVMSLPPFAHLPFMSLHIQQLERSSFAFCLMHPITVIANLAVCNNIGVVVVSDGFAFVDNG